MDMKSLENLKDLGDLKDFEDLVKLGGDRTSWIFCKNKISLLNVVVFSYKFQIL